MRIGIDAKWLQTGPPSGRVVVGALVRELLALDSPHEWILFVDDSAPRPDDLRRPGVELIPTWAGINQISNVFVLPRLAAKHRVDVVLYQYFAPVWGAARRVVMIHDVIFESHPEYFTRAERAYFTPMRFLASRADRVCTVSHAERERLIRYGYALPDRVDVIRNGVSAEFKPRERHDPHLLRRIRERHRLPERFVLFVGRLNVRKNLRGLLQALPLLPEANVPCVIVGEQDWRQDEWTSLAKGMEAAGRVRMIGRLESADLAALYSLATAFCFPSFDEGFGLPALEAMASGVPVVVSDQPSLREVCGEAAVYVDPANPRSIADGLSRVLHDSDLRRAMRDRGLARASSFSWKQSAQQLMRSLERAAKRRASCD